MMPSEDFLSLCLVIAFTATAVSQVLAMLRLVIGPNAGDRILALDTMVLNVIAMIVAVGMYQGTVLYFEVSLIIAMLGFVSTVAYARFVLRGDIIE